MITSEEPTVSSTGRYTVTQTCEILGIHRNTLREYTSSGRIKCGFRRESARKFYEILEGTIMNETFLALSMCLCIGLFWAILFLFRALESRIRQELTGLCGKIGETDSRLLKIYLLTLEEKINSLIEEERYEEAQSLTLLLKKELNPLNEEQDDKHE